MPGCRRVKYVQHSSTIPLDVVQGEDYRWCTCQCDEVSKGLSEEDRMKDVIATHEKTQTCGACCCYVPYLKTKDAKGKTIGKTEYVCDGWCEYPDAKCNWRMRFCFVASHPMVIYFHTCYASSLCAKIRYLRC